MSASKVTDPRAVRRAIKEFDRLGRDAFLDRYGFARSKGYRLRVTARGTTREYDPAAVVAVAHREQHGRVLAPREVKGAHEVLERLGFEIVDLAPPWTEDERVLALDVYLRHPGERLDATHPEVRTLSAVLRRLAGVQDRSGDAAFRNSARVALEIGRFLALDPRSEIEGAREPSREHRELWDRLAHKTRPRSRRVAAVMNELESLPRAGEPGERRERKAKTKGKGTLGGKRGAAAETVPSEAVPSEAAPTESATVDAVPTDAVPSEAAPTDAAPSAEPGTQLAAEPTLPEFKGGRRLPPPRRTDEWRVPFVPEPRPKPPREPATSQADRDKHARAVTEHWRLRDELATFLRSERFTLYDRHTERDDLRFDLNAERGDLSLLIEIKSLPPDGKDHDTLRYGLGQVLWYHARCHEGRKPKEAHLRFVPVLFVEREPADAQTWRALCSSVGVLLTWPALRRSMVEECVVLGRGSPLQQ